MKTNFYLTGSYKSYNNLTINEKINFRQYRNTLNINHLFGTALRCYKNDDYLSTQTCKKNNGIYHK